MSSSPLSVVRCPLLLPLTTDNGQGTRDSDPGAPHMTVETKPGVTIRPATEFRVAIDSKIPDGPIEQKWDTARFKYKLVNPANKRRYTVIVVGAGLAGASAAA